MFPYNCPNRLNLLTIVPVISAVFPYNCPDCLDLFLIVTVTPDLIYIRLHFNFPQFCTLVIIWHDQDDCRKTRHCWLLIFFSWCWPAGRASGVGRDSLAAPGTDRLLASLSGEAAQGVLGETVWCRFATDTASHAWGTWKLKQTLSSSEKPSFDIAGIRLRERSNCFSCDALTCSLWHIVSCHVVTRYVVSCSRAFEI